MEHDFHGPSYTIGIEEELMIVDPEGYGLVNAIESLLEDAEDGEIKPELWSRCSRSPPTRRPTRARPATSCAACAPRSAARRRGAA